ncbi:hypothetical protein MMC18_006311 [Xylographa bjoerkii]|nr:hypothetical protein [Xylographa bjoerkii]
MPFIFNTPENLLLRSDSKDPSTTCKGIIANGRPCRRKNTASSRASPATMTSVPQGSLTVAPKVNARNEGAAALFCWQHQNQAEILAPSSCGNHTQVLDLRKRTSVDTLVERLQVFDVKDSIGSKTKNETGQGHRSTERRTMPEQGHRVPGLPKAGPDEPSNIPGNVSLPRVPQPQQRRKPKGSLILHLSLFFCIQGPDLETEFTPPPRIKPTQPARRTPEMAQTPKPRPKGRPVPAQHSLHAQAFHDDHWQTPSNAQGRPSLNHESTPRSQTHTLLALIPPSLSPQTTSLLLAELAKPLPPSSEPGYIYMFWLTPGSTPAPSPDTASSLLTQAVASRRRTSDVVRPFVLPDHGASSDTKRITLKIGRASNVQRRLNEWTRQCGYNLSLIRYYPYHSSSPSSQPPSPMPSPRARPSSGALADRSGDPEGMFPRKVPHVARVERLIHLELAEKRVKRLCAGCTKEHREWFEVEATREGLRQVDEVVRRWVGWGTDLGER